MRIGVTGGSGYVGSVLIPKLIGIGAKVDCFDIRPPTSALFKGIDPGKFRFHQIDVADQFALRPFENQFDFIIHLAALVGYPACNRTPALAKRSNVSTTESLMNTKGKRTRLLLASTISVYGDQPGTRVDEESETIPNSIYGATKKAAEELVSKEPSNIIFRFAGAFGASPQMRRDNLIHDFCFRALAGESIAVFEKDYLRQFIHVSDMTDAMVFAVKNWSRFEGQIFNVGNPQLEFTKEAVIKCMTRLIPFRYFFDNKSGFDAEKRNYPISFEKILSLGFTTKISLEPGIREIINHYRSTIAPPNPIKEMNHAA